MWESGFIVARAHGCGYVRFAHSRPDRTCRNPTNDRKADVAYAADVDAWVIWAIVAGALAIAEVLTLTFVLGLVSLSAVGASIAAASGVSGTGQWILFGVADAVLLVGVLPTARRHLRTAPAVVSGAARIIGTRVLSISEITTADGGQVRINGDAWSARPDVAGAVIAPDQWVEVVRIEGATAIVHPAAEPSS